MTFIKYLDKVDVILERLTGKTSTQEMMDDIGSYQESDIDVEECCKNLIKTYNLV